MDIGLYTESIHTQIIDLRIYSRALYESGPLIGATALCNKVLEEAVGDGPPRLQAWSHYKRRGNAAPRLLFIGPYNIFNNTTRA